MEIVLAAVQADLRDAFIEHTEGLGGVTVHHGSIFDVECDAVVSPANSFGFMDGGIDAQYVSRFGGGVQERVRRKILYEHAGELLVGAATIVETGIGAPRYLIAAPTMRVPMWLGPETVAPYLAARAVILLVREGRFGEGPGEGEPVRGSVRRIAFPGLGTGVGGVPAEVSARQMAEAIRRHRDGPHELPGSWADASVDHQLLYTNAPRMLQRPPG